MKLASTVPPPATIKATKDASPGKEGWRLPFLALLLLVSGACALIYQTAWLREFRLIFGGSTPATAAVLAVFMGGLGAGGAWFGRRAERTENLLGLYAVIELATGVIAALTPLLLDLVRALYVKTGGVLTLGSVGATLAQLFLAAIVLGPPCFLLGGNLPPAVKWIETDADRQRGSLGVVYGCNAFGAVIGVLVGTFWALEHLGTRGTLWCAAAGNVLLGLIAAAVASRERRRELPAAVAAEPGTTRAPDAGHNGVTAPAKFVYAAAGATGFLFFFVEIVWYRMLTPLLGGSVYCFGLILAQVLLGIAMGGWLYRMVIAPRAGWTNLGTLALTLTAQAAALAIPLALGDRLAVMTYHWLQWRAMGFGWLIAGWSCTVAITVLLPAMLAGVQFPLLVALLGEGRRNAARQVGTAYAANTVGAILGSIAGGFVLLPYLTAPGCWRLAVGLTLVLAFAALLTWERPWHPAVMTGTLAFSVLGVGMGFYSTGPSASWRHSAIGYGIVRSLPSSASELEDSLRSHRRHLAREYEGRESSIAVMRGDEGHALFSNGKADGSALSDAGTQIMLGLVSALQHPAPRSAFVIGLGTGTSAGWLAEVPGMERVDVAELEPRVIDVAREYFAQVNRGVVTKTNVHIIVGDAREVLLATDRTYDLVVSEPPNPYRAGVANLFTREYYEAARKRLAPGGIFSQWLQGYQLAAESVQLVYATLLSVFPHVETWVTQGNDLMFVCHAEAPAYSEAQLRERLAQAPFKEAVARAWLADTLDGVVARHFAGPATARRIAAPITRVNTDDRNLLEYGIAWTQLGQAAFHYKDLLEVAQLGHDDVPAHLRDAVDLALIGEARMHLFAQDGDLDEPPKGLEGEALDRARAIVAWGKARHDAVLEHWRGPANSPADRLMLAISAGRAGTPAQTAPLLAAIQQDWPADTQMAAAWVMYRHDQLPTAVNHVAESFRALRLNPWAQTSSLLGLVELSAMLVSARPEDAGKLLEAWQTQLPTGHFGRSAPLAWYRLAYRLPVLNRLQVLDAIGPNHLWTKEFLIFRLESLKAAEHPLAAEARRDLERLIAQEGRPMQDVVGK